MLKRTTLNSKTIQRMDTKIYKIQIKKILVLYTRVSKKMYNIFFKSLENCLNYTRLTDFYTSVSKLFFCKNILTLAVSQFNFKKRASIFYTCSLFEYTLYFSAFSNVYFYLSSFSVLCLKTIWFQIVLSDSVAAGIQIIL